MIRCLRIENFALIDSLELNFKEGFTIITGETGSGKSILLNALNLILGERANFSVIGLRSDKSIVEAELDISNFDLAEFFTENELDYFDVAIVRREIAKNGRSRAFINDTPVQLNILKDFTSQLVHIHSQYNTLELKDRGYQLDVLDVLADTKNQRSKYAEKYADLLDKKALLSTLQKDLSERLSKEDYNSFQLNELKDLRLEELNYSEIQRQARSAEFAEEVRNSLAEFEALATDERGIISLLQRAKNALSKITNVSPQMEELAARVESVRIEMKDIVDEAMSSAEKIDMDPSELLQLQGMLDAYNRALVKHGFTSQEELIAYFNDLDHGAADLSELEYKIETLESDINILEKVVLEEALRLHESRIKAIDTIEAKLNHSLDLLKLANAKLTFVTEKLEEPKSTGLTGLEIYFAPNAGVPAVPVHQAASGGELSRVMLALQDLMSKKTQLRSVLFDEIDTGVSGEVAQRMGEMLRQMGEGMQVIAITHLPQVAALGRQHFKVSKALKGDSTLTDVIELSREERITETARLMSGDEITDAALENAKALMRT